MRKTVWLLFGGLILAYLANIATVAIYKAATADQMIVLGERMASLARLDGSSSRIEKLDRLNSGATFSSFTTSAPYAIYRRNEVTRHLRSEPHLSLGIAVDEVSPDDNDIISLLRQVNTALIPHRISLGLATDMKKISIPHHSTRADLLYGVTTAFEQSPDYLIAFTNRRCRYRQSRKTSERTTYNRLYTFGRRGVTIVDHARIDPDLVRHVTIDLARFATENRVEKRWQSSDYNTQLRDVLNVGRPKGRATLRNRNLRLAKQDRRVVSLTIALDDVTKADARNYIKNTNLLFDQYDITFEIRHIYTSPLRDGWKWPLEVKKMQQRSQSDIYLLLTPHNWFSQRSGYVRGLGNYLFGAVMVQTGTDAQTLRRITHELGHLFGLQHTFLKGHIMYPNEKHIGLTWSPGSKRLLRENRFHTTWQSANRNPARLDLAIRLSPPMTRRSPTSRSLRNDSTYAGTDSWVICK